MSGVRETPAWAAQVLFLAMGLGQLAERLWVSSASSPEKGGHLGATVKTRRSHGCERSFGRF